MNADVLRLYRLAKKLEDSLSIVRKQIADEERIAEEKKLLAQKRKAALEEKARQAQVRRQQKEKRRTEQAAQRTEKLVQAKLVAAERETARIEAEQLAEIERAVSGREFRRARRDKVAERRVVTTTNVGRVREAAEFVAASASDHYKTPIASRTIFERGGTPRVMACRTALTWICREKFGFSLEETGRCMGSDMTTIWARCHRPMNSDTASVLHGALKLLASATTETRGEELTESSEDVGGHVHVAPSRLDSAVV